MSYMLLDIMRFVGFFLVIYFSFTFCTTFVYTVYDDFNQDSNFVEYKKAFKYFFWALIRTGNPEFAEIKTPVYMSSTHHETTNYETKLDGYCLQEMLKNNTTSELISFETIKNCFYFVNVSLPSTQWSNCTQLSDDKQACELKNDEGFFFVIGNVLWASYQFLLVIVLLSILRAKMINTYQSIIQEADMQWKFFR